MFGISTALNSGGMAFILLRHASTIVIILSIASFVMSFIRLHAGLAISGIITILMSGYGIFGYYKLISYFSEVSSKGNEASAGGSAVFNPSSLLQMVHLQFGIWVIMLAGVILIVAAFFPRAN